MKKLYIFILLVATLVSCRKIDDVTPSDSPKPTKELNINSSFNWKTSKEVTLNVIGLKNVSPQIKNTLYINSTIGDTTYYKDLLIMNTDYTIKFTVPSTETKVVLIYGSKSKTLDLLSNEITFDYIIE